MDLIHKTIMIHGGDVINILTPRTLSGHLASGHDDRGYLYIWANGTGYGFLAECLMVAANLRINEILYLPLKYNAGAGFRATFNQCEWDYGIVCVNYCESQSSIKNIEKYLSARTQTETVINRVTPKITTRPDPWQIERRLTIKMHKKNMYIYTNKDGYVNLAEGASYMAEYGDCSYDESLPHRHYDWDQNTKASAGVTLFHWHEE